MPVGLLGSYLYQFRFSSILLGKYTDKAVEDLNTKLWPDQLFFIQRLPHFIIRSACFIALYLGAPLIADVIKALEGTVVIHILEVVGGGLAAIGIATTVYVIGRKDYLVFSSLLIYECCFEIFRYYDGYLCHFGIIIALIFVQSQKGNKYSLPQAITIQHL